MFEKEKRENLKAIRQFEAAPPKAEDWDGSVDFFPRYLQIEHTTRCNARCIMCNHLYTANRGAGDIDVNVLYGLEEILPYAETAMLNGDGEPLLYADIDQSLALLRKYGVKVGTNTNLTVIPDGLWAYFADSFAFLNISCDGSTAELYENIRKGLSFADFVKNLKKLNQVAPQLRKNLDCVLMRQNIGDMENLVRFAAEQGFASVRFHTLGVNPIIGNQKDAPMLYGHYLADNAEKAAQTAQALGIRIQLPAVVRPAEGSAALDLQRICDEEPAARVRVEKVAQYREKLSWQYLGTPVQPEDLTPATFAYGDLCRWAVARCYIDLHGNMTTCCYDVSHRYGNLKEQSFREIWNGPLYRQLRREMVQGRLPAWCRTCQWLKNPEF